MIRPTRSAFSDAFMSAGFQFIRSNLRVARFGLVVAALSFASPGRAAEIRSHRGNLWGHPEHTLESYDAVVKAGAQVVEIDVQLTSERMPICLHDPTLERTTTGTGVCAELSLAEIKSADAGARYGSVFVGRKVPTLEEALTFLKTRRTKVLIEPKVEAAAEIERAITAAGYPLDRISLLNSTVAGRSAYSAINSQRPYWLICGGTPSSMGSATLVQLKATGWNGLSFWPNTFIPKDYVLAHRAGLEVGVYGVSADNVMTYVDEGADLLLTDNPGGFPSSLMDGYARAVWDRFIISHALPAELASQVADADTDGLSNLEEFAYGTNPADRDVIPSDSQPIMQTIGAPGQREIVLSVAIPPQKMECLWFSVLTSLDGMTWSAAPEHLVREDQTAWPTDTAWRFRIKLEGDEVPSMALFRVKPHFFPRS
jgi:glycerophosphoryl diester phosphodiesterase